MVSPAPIRGPLPPAPPALALWIAARLHEPSPDWIPATANARALPHPVNLPGMHKAVAALIARYRFTPPEWHADVLQDFMGRWLLRPQSALTLARSAVTGLRRGQVATLEAGIAWKLRLELLSQAHRAYARVRRDAERRRTLERLVAVHAARVREAAADGAPPATVPMGD